MAWLYKQKESTVWWIGYRLNGKQVLKSTGETDRKKAETVLANVETMIRHQKQTAVLASLYETLTGTVTTTISLSAALDKWIEECRHTTKPGTQDAYRTVAKQIRAHVKATPEKPLLAQINQDTVFDFLNDMAKRRAVSTANNRKKVLSTFFLWAVGKKYITSNPAEGIKKFKRTSKVEKVGRRAFNMDEFKKILAQCPNDFWRYMVLGEFYTGLRLGDLICLRRFEVKLAENCLSLEMLKVDDKEVKIPMARPIRQAIEQRLAEVGKIRENDYLWPEQARIYLNHGKRPNSGYFSNEFYDLVLAPLGLVEPRENKKKAKGGRGTKRVVNEVSFHSLRHSFISMLKVSGAPQSVAKELAGHSSDAVNDLYTHVPLDVLTKAIDLLPQVNATT